MKIKVSTATEIQIDWLVAKAQKSPVSDSDLVKLVLTMDCYKTSTNWEQGGPLIEQEGISVSKDSIAGNFWFAAFRASGMRPVLGPTPLIAAMRCYVMSKMGEEVEVPDELA